MSHLLTRPRNTYWSSIGRICPCSAPSGQNLAMDEQTRAQFEAAVERKKQQSRERSQQERRPDDASAGGIHGDQESLVSNGRKSQDAISAREKSSGKGHKTADKWNQ